jgi:hypothetical protein
VVRCGHGVVLRTASCVNGMSRGLVVGETSLSYWAQANCMAILNFCVLYSKMSLW